MADADRTATHALSALDGLREAPWRYEFYQALRLIESAHPQRPRLGESARPHDDPVRLALKPSLAFAPSELAAFESQPRGLPPSLSVLFFGLLGPNGPLPLHLTEYAMGRMRDFGDHTFRRFLDLFHHRMISLFYRGWANAHAPAEFDRPETDRFQRWIGSLAGYGMESLRRRDAAPDFAKLYHAGAFACHTRHAEGLEKMLAAFFGARCRIEEFVGQWLDIPREYRWRLGADPTTGALGRNTVLGARAWECQQRFRIDLGPMTLERYRRLLPGAASLRRLVDLVRNYVGDELTWDLRLILAREEVPRISLGRNGRLGWTTWLLSGEARHPADDLVLDPVRTTKDGEGLSGRSPPPAAVA